MNARNRRLRTHTTCNHGRQGIRITNESTVFTYFYRTNGLEPAKKISPVDKYHRLNYYLGPDRFSKPLWCPINEIDTARGNEK